jgi:hypothetical protein
LNTSTLFRLGKLTALGVLTAAAVACGGGGGTSTAPTLSPADIAANTKAVTDMGSTPVTDATVWNKLNTAGTDTVRSMEQTATPSNMAAVTVSTFTSITNDPNYKGDSSTPAINVFSGIVATGLMDIATRNITWKTGTLPLTGDVWVNVAGEDFSKGNTFGENALEISVAALQANPLPAPTP